MEKTLNWEPANSDTIEKFAWVPEYGDLLVVFVSGGQYVYREVEPELVAKLRKPHPWRKVGEQIKGHRWEKLGSIRTRPLKRTKRSAASPSGGEGSARTLRVASRSGSGKK